MTTRANQQSPADFALVACIFVTDLALLYQDLIAIFDDDTLLGIAIDARTVDVID